MFLLALAGGATALAGEDVLGCCGGFIIMPAVVLLILVAWVADSPWAGWTALAVAGLTYLVASLMVAGYEPSRDWEVVEEQATGVRLAEQYGWLTVAAGSSLGAVGARRAFRWLWPLELSPIRRPTAAERLAMVDDMASRGLVSVEEAASLRQRLKSSGAGS